MIAAASAWARHEYLTRDEALALAFPRAASIEARQFEFDGAATDPYGNLRLGFTGSVPINRRDFGVNWNAALETGGFLVSDRVVLEFEVSAIKTG